MSAGESDTVRPKSTWGEHMVYESSMKVPKTRRNTHKFKPAFMSVTDNQVILYKKTKDPQNKPSSFKRIWKMNLSLHMDAWNADDEEIVEMENCDGLAPEGLIRIREEKAQRKKERKERRKRERREREAKKRENGGQDKPNIIYTNWKDRYKDELDVNAPPPQQAPQPAMAAAPTGPPPVPGIGGPAAAPAPPSAAMAAAATAPPPVPQAQAAPAVPSMAPAAPAMPGSPPPAQPAYSQPPPVPGMGAPAAPAMPGAAPPVPQAAVAPPPVPGGPPPVPGGYGAPPPVPGGPPPVPAGSMPPPVPGSMPPPVPGAGPPAVPNAGAPPPVPGGGGPPGGGPPRPAGPAGLDLLSAIRQGAQLKKAEPIQKKPDERVDILSQIRAGANLKHVEHKEKQVEEDPSPSGGIAAILARRLVIAADSDSDDSAGSEWD